MFDGFTSRCTSGGVRGVERRRDLAQQRQRPFRGEWPPAQQPPQVVALDQHHVEVELPVDLPERVHRHRVRVHQGRRELRLPPEPGPEALVHVPLRQALERHHAAVLDIEGLVHGAHAAAAQELEHAVRAEHGRGRVDLRHHRVHGPPVPDSAASLRNGHRP
jgi:hypothetical protein